MAVLTTWISIQHASIHPATIGIPTVTPSVVLLDNHTTIGKGWKWENPPINPWDGYFARYIKLADYDIRLQPFDLFYGGYVNTGPLSNAGANSYYYSCS